jgi:hypothetical protein
MAGRIEKVDQTEDGSRRLRFEIIFASVWLAIGLFLVPALIFWVGIVMLGPYGEAQGAGLGTFYGDFFGDLANGEVRTWALTLGPLALISLIRAMFIGARSKTTTEPEARVTAPAEPRASAADQRRREPRIDE